MNKNPKQTKQINGVYYHLKHLVNSKRKNNWKIQIQSLITAMVNRCNLSHYIMYTSNSNIKQWDIKVFILLSKHSYYCLSYELC